MLYKRHGEGLNRKNRLFNKQNNGEPSRMKQSTPVDHVPLDVGVPSGAKLSCLLKTYSHTPPAFDSKIHDCEPWPTVQP